MESKHMHTVVLVLFFAVTVIQSKEALEYCLNHMETICFPCRPISAEDPQCIEISREMKIINFDTHVNVSYHRYSNSSVKMIQEPNKVTFLSCGRGNDDNYFQVQSYSYYPVGHTLHFSPYSVGMQYIQSALFQTCLNYYCVSIRNNMLKCRDPLVDGFGFSFNSNITLPCVQNITYASITSDRISEITKNPFFVNAYNIINLVLDLNILRSFQCNAFQRLNNLRVLKINLNKSSVIETKVYECFFKFNPKLVMIDINGNWIWQSCHLPRTVNTYSKTVAIVLSLALVVSILTTLLPIALYLRKHYKRGAHQNDIELNRWRYF